MYLWILFLTSRANIESPFDKEIYYRKKVEEFLLLYA